ncbi:hypothetical protein [Ruminiclostridium papyrosolvens]|uniref:Uncharacterized protein n=1 Tax=Ruminiclostridium papyrosolvens C7 TaxID=1330534 RepID=U4R2I2_9FIRM|nr:hypothetical protein [Ruminiclostridium papyrosolvens]EPR12344.1 hypothetical protein L323_08560 [Ruminiclostridium papyrosolvens C7]
MAQLELLRNKSIELFNTINSKLNNEDKHYLFEYETILTEIQIVESKMLDDKTDDNQHIIYDFYSQK